MLGAQAPAGGTNNPQHPTRWLTQKKPAEHAQKYPFAAYLWELLLLASGPQDWESFSPMLHGYLGIQAVWGRGSCLQHWKRKKKSPTPSVREPSDWTGALRLGQRHAPVLLHREL